MSSKYEITRHESGGGTIIIWIRLVPDGGLAVTDYSYGPAADVFYGTGHGVESSLALEPDAVRRLHTLLADRDDPDPADKLARRLVKMFSGDTLALRKIRNLCDEHDIEYDKALWV